MRLDGSSARPAMGESSRHTRRRADPRICERAKLPTLRSPTPDSQVSEARRPWGTISDDTGGAGEHHRHKALVEDVSSRKNAPLFCHFASGHDARTS